MEKDLVSIVVPVYNSEKYLEECIESIIHQTYTNLEIIFVDDGSTDSSVDIISRYKESDNRIQLYKQKNQYAGVARNNGMKHATGKYIMFLDSDDYFELNMIEKLHNTAVKHNTEVVECNFISVDDVTNEISTKLSRHKSAKYVYVKKADNIFNILMYNPWSKFILKTVLDRNNLIFQNISSCNDVGFSQVLSCLVEKVIYVKEKLIIYRVHEGSIQYKKNEEYVVKLKKNDIEAAKYIYSELKKRKIFKSKIKNDYYLWLDSYVRYIINSSQQTMYFDKIYDSIKTDLIPHVYENIYDLNRNSFLYRIYISKNAYNFLLAENTKLLNETVSITSKSYRIGNFILAIPKWVYKAIRGV